LLLLTLRSFGAIPEAAIAPMHVTANFLTIMSMAALGLGVDARSVSAGRLPGRRSCRAWSLAGVGMSSSFFLIKMLGIV